MKVKAQHRRREGGFTLVEMVMVVVIIGLLAAMALPRFTGLSTQAKSVSDGLTKNAADTQGDCIEQFVGTGLTEERAKALCGGTDMVGGNFVTK
ncbi:MAG: prepilin-type N-terminal cleavage/methylation domain-containing protein [Magnetococcales bacterium]|nr:prepilin-type N-terminal cleavage/methylation domain-containing protein [Magnetococcales bacterium]